MNMCNVISNMKICDNLHNMLSQELSLDNYVI